MKIVAAGIMLQTLYFKFSAAEESVYIFTTLGLEPYGRIGIGVLELMNFLIEAKAAANKSIYAIGA